MSDPSAESVPEVAEVEEEAEVVEEEESKEAEVDEGVDPAQRILDIEANLLQHTDSDLVTSEKLGPDNIEFVSLVTDVPTEQVLSTVLAKLNDSQKRVSVQKALGLDGIYKQALTSWPGTRALPTGDDFKVTKLEFRAHTEAFSGAEVALVEGLDAVCDPASGTCTERSDTFYQYLGTASIKKNLADVVGWTDAAFTQRKYHAMALQARLLSATNTSGSAFRVHLEVANLEKHAESALLTQRWVPLSTPTALCCGGNDGACGVTIPAHQSEGPLKSAPKGVMYKAERGTFSDPHATRFCGADYDDIVARARAKYQNKQYMYFPDTLDNAVDDVATHIVHAYLPLIKAQDAALNPDDSEGIQMKEVTVKGDKGNKETRLRIPVNAFEQAVHTLCYKHSSSGCGLNLAAPMRLAYTFANGEAGRADFLINSSTPKGRECPFVLGATIELQYVVLRATGAQHERMSDTAVATFLTPLLAHVEARERRIKATYADLRNRRAAQLGIAVPPSRSAVAGKMHHAVHDPHTKKKPATAATVHPASMGAPVGPRIGAWTGGRSSKLAVQKWRDEDDTVDAFAPRDSALVPYGRSSSTTAALD